MMKEIKSVKAISKINDLKEEYNPAVILDIIDIVELAEQDAEERAYDAVKLLLQECRERIKNGEEADEVLFSSLARYNWILNGGQSDE